MEKSGGLLIEGRERLDPEESPIWGINGEREIAWKQYGPFLSGGGVENVPIDPNDLLFIQNFEGRQALSLKPC